MPGDRLWPPPAHLLGWNPVVRLEQAGTVRIWRAGQGLSQPASRVDRLPANLLAAENIRLFPGDRILWNGQPVPFDFHLPYMSSLTLQYQPAARLIVHIGEDTRAFSSAAPSPYEALWEAGIRLYAADRLTSAGSGSGASGQNLVLSRAVPLTIRTAGGEIATLSSAATVGEALADASVSLQGSDTSFPPEDQPLPADGQIRVVRVREEVVLAQIPIPFGSETVNDPDSPLGQTNVIAAGQAGLKVSRQRVRYEDGQEVARSVEAEWIAREPVKQKVSYGTKVTGQVLDTSGGPIEYWHSETVYATSYSPCRSGTSICSNVTASGMTVQRGVIGVTSAWYKLLAGQPVYIPGYGRAVVADIGGGIPGKKWIDLGFTDADYESWHQDVTIYFLYPMPANVPAVLP
jgi:resuscitation-promoting factor RpfB